jgi:hypothetical protein
MPPTPTHAKAWVVTVDGQVYGLGRPSFGSVSGGINRVHDNLAARIEATPNGSGYWIADRLGAVWAFGAAHNYGTLAKSTLVGDERVMSLRTTPTGLGYWLATTKGRVFAFGDAHLYGDLHGVRLGAPARAMTPTPSGHGYWIMLGNGKVYAFGDAVSFGTFRPTGGANFVDLLAGTTNAGYTLVAKNGKTFAFGTGVLAPMHLGVKAPVAASAFGNGFVVTDAAGKTAVHGTIVGCGNLAMKHATRIVGITTTS